MSEERAGRLSESAARALTFAADLADGQGLADVNCQHLLLALASEPGGLARIALERAGMPYEALKVLVMQESAAYERDGSGDVGMALELQEVIVRAGLISQQAGQRVVDTEQLLRALAEQSTSADDLFAAMRVAPARLIEALQGVLAQAPAADIRKEQAQAPQFTLECSWAFAHAQDAARHEGAAQIEARHLMLALMQVDGELAAALHEAFGLSRQEVADLMGARAGRRSGAGSRRLPLSKEIEAACGSALAQAWAGSYPQINPALLLAGLACLPDHSLRSFLASFGAGEAELLDLLARRFPARGSTAR